jgi:hypothetical protein
MSHQPWTREAIDLLIADWRPHEIAEHYGTDVAKLVDRLSEAGVEFRGKLGRESAARRAERRQGGRAELLQKLLYAQAELARARDRQQAAEKERDGWRSTAESLRASHAGEIGQLNGQVAKLERSLTRAYAHIHSTEPGPVEGCTKVRLRDQDEAWEFAKRVAEDTGQRLELFNVYPCDICPRQPVGTSRFLHITSKETDQERLEARARTGGQRKRNGTALGDRIDPAVLERLRSV